MIVLNDIKKRLSQAIKQSGMTQQAIADKVGIRQQTVSDYIKGKSLPALDTLANLCVVLDIDANEILCIKD